MSFDFPRRNPPKVQAASVPVIRYNAKRAEDAFQAHAALLQWQALNPALADNPAWQVLVADAYENFTLAFEAVQ